MTESEYARERARLERERSETLAEQQQACKVLQRIQARMEEAHKAALERLETRRLDLELQWAASEETRERCSRCGYPRHEHDKDADELAFYTRITLTGCLAFVPYEAAETPPSETKRLRHAQARETQRKAFWSQNKPNLKEGK